MTAATLGLIGQWVRITCPDDDPWTPGLVTYGEVEDVTEDGTEVLVNDGLWPATYITTTQRWDA